MFLIFKSCRRNMKKHYGGPDSFYVHALLAWVWSISHVVASAFFEVHNMICIFQRTGSITRHHESPWCQHDPTSTRRLSFCAGPAIKCQRRACSQLSTVPFSVKPGGLAVMARFPSVFGRRKPSLLAMIRWPHWDLRRLETSWGDQGILSGECRGRSKSGGPSKSAPGGMGEMGVEESDETSRIFCGHVNLSEMNGGLGVYGGQSWIIIKRRIGSLIIL